ncbi:flavodoxin [Enterococcus sp. DIV0242_7C1]|uniref:Flavodoxin n=2 Tax=Enterococcus TaxID=1350 RepID=A0A200JD68_9ENTE|nr:MULTISPECIES: flavodoxin [Enterococcus]MBO0469559.1 flavodoxin [Enterococcus sp. DIV0242_7C1]MCA5011912.1 flavodoxin [Enterococcus sp. S23]MCA5014646.1 flavodoxin [Enterococcus sp. S22(2020)]OUZ35153.1 flavodoxin [Enterococcus sp. 9D6_DIV0238]GGC78920.1 flavodoxin [Enterococcus wangshanyuanii]
MALVKIVYASMTGNTEEISEILESTVQDAGFEVEREECSEVDVDFFDDADACVIATYTYGDGELPFEFEDFFDELEDKDLSGKIFGVVGSGDREYGDLFCKSAHDFVEALEKAGAKKVAETVEIENNAEDEDVEALKKFVTELTAGL